MLKTIGPILRCAGSMMLHYAAPAVASKGRRADFVTEADVAVQEHLISALSAAFPHAQFFAEEKDGNVLTDAFTFIIDPIDGTTNYFRHRRCSMISIGAVEHGQPVLGMLFDPNRD